MEQLRDQDFTGTEETSPLPSPQPSPGRQSPLTFRRANTAQGPRRRIVHVAALSRLIAPLAQLSFDRDHGVAQAARHLLFYFMKEDPNLLSRPIFDLLVTSERHDVQDAFTTLEAYLHITPVLPPIFAHTVFNHLAGYLKHVKQNQSPSAFSLYSAALPLLTQVAPHVSEMSLKALRKDKLDTFMLPSLDLWFPPTAPDGVMFPRYLTNPAQPLPELKDIVMIRTAQNMLMLRLLQQNPAEVQMLRKTTSRLVLPTKDGGTPVTALDLADFVPVASRPHDHGPVEHLSKVLARSFVLLITHVFRCLPSHLNDRQELEVHLDGLNRILVTHGHDELLVTHVMIGKHSHTVDASVMLSDIQPS
jgi:hypothetical protein